MQLWSVCLQEDSDLSLMLLPAAEYALLHHTSRKLLWRKATKTRRLPVICGGGVVIEQSGPKGAVVASIEQQCYNKKKETWGVLPVSGPSMGKSNEIICVLIYGESVDRRCLGLPAPALAPQVIERWLLLF